MITEVLKIDSANPQVEYIIKAADVLKAGGIVAFPTETVYGLGVNCFDAAAVEKLYKVKERPAEKPFTIHICDTKDLVRFDCQISRFAEELIDKFWPGPVTLIFNTSNSGTLGFRFPNNRVAQELIKQSNTLIAAPSANMTGGKPPTDAKEVLEQFKDRIDLILDAGQTQLGKESTIIDLTVSPYRILRAGAVSRDKIAQVEFDFWKNRIAPGIKKILFVCTGNSCRSVMAEGYLKKRLKQVGRDDIEVDSRGVSAPAMMRPTRETLEVLKSDSIDVSNHRAASLTENDISGADLILAMEKFQVDEILERMPSKTDDVYLLGEFGLWGGRVQDMPLEITDPIGRPPEVYKNVYNMIKSSIERLVKILV